jgi:hypothetical protein
MHPHDRVESLFAPPTGEAEAVRERAKEFAHFIVDNMGACDESEIEEALLDLRSVVSIIEAAIVESAAREG